MPARTYQRLFPVESDQTKHGMGFLIFAIIAVQTRRKKTSSTQQPTTERGGITPSSIDHNHPSTKAHGTGRASWLGGRGAHQLDTAAGRGQASRRVACMHSRSERLGQRTRTRPGPRCCLSLAEFLAPRSSFFLFSPEMPPPQPVDSSSEKALKACGGMKPIDPKVVLAFRSGVCVCVWCRFWAGNRSIDQRIRGAPCIF